jgi:hypothetical protein
MAAPTNAALVKKALANSEPSTHGPSLQMRLQQILVDVGGTADIDGCPTTAENDVNDPKATFRAVQFARMFGRGSFGAYLVIF